MTKPRVLATSRLPGDTHNLLSGSFDLCVNQGESFTVGQLLEGARGKDAIITVLVDRLDEKFFESAPEIKLVVNVAAGYDNIDLKAARAKGVLVCHTPGAVSQSTADLAFALMLAIARKLPASESFLRNGCWKNFALDLLLGVDVHHKTLGIVGLGRIGQALAARARGFSMKVLYSQRHQAPAQIGSELQASYLSLEELLANSDFVSLHCPLQESTRHLIGERQLRLMKNSAFLINTARGAIVDEFALAEALEQGTIAGAGLDVFEREPEVTAKLLRLDNVVLLPHVGSATVETRTAMGRMAVNAVVTAFRGIMPQNTLTPECWERFLERSSQLGLLNAQ